MHTNDKSKYASITTNDISFSRYKVGSRFHGNRCTDGQNDYRNPTAHVPKVNNNYYVNKGAFYTRSKFTLKVLAEYGYAFLLLWENFK